MSDGLTISLFDTEGDDLLDGLTRLHCLVVRKIIDGNLQPARRFRRNEHEDTIWEGLCYLIEDADYVCGQNIVGFDLPGIEKVYPDFWLPEGVAIRDTEVMARQVFPDQKEKDFDLFKRGLLPGQHIGAHTLEAWGHRLGIHKGDYAKEMEAEAKAKGITDPAEVKRYVWGSWNPRMDDYCAQDVDVTVALWLKIIAEIQRLRWPVDSIIMRHRAHELMVRQQQSGFGFDVEGALRLAEHFREELEVRKRKAIDHFGTYAYPAKIYRLGDVKKKGQVVHQAPRAEYGEDNSRDAWGEVIVPTKRMKDGREPGHPFCPMIMKEFKPTSRQQIVNRLKVIHNWVPTEFTEKGGVKVSDDILRPLAEQWPICETLADVFFYQKMLGAVAGSDPEAVRDHLAGLTDSCGDDDASGDDDEDEAEIEADADEPAGDLFAGMGLEDAPAAPAVIKRKKRKKSSAWLLHFNTRTGCIHHRCVVGATISTRAAHSNPNLGQVKSVEGAKKEDPHNLTQEVSAWSRKTGGEWKHEIKRVRTGYHGNYGFECRSLFKPKPGFQWQTGIDLSGIEMRALGARLKPFDDGEFLSEVTTPGKDPHITNGIAFGLAANLAEAEAVKPKSKRLFYAMVYGGGDLQLGSIILPPGASAEAMKARGKDLKETFLRGRPAFRRLLKAIEAEARNGFIVALDGSPLPVRKAHAALNLKLQSDGAIIATKWGLLIDERLPQEGIFWEEDYTMLAYVHDEDQFGSKEREVAFRIGDIALQAAADAGEFFGYAAPVAAEAKVGLNWAECH